jgi:hypothetical protein
MSHTLQAGYCFGETQILIALLVVAVIIALWITGNIGGGNSNKQRHYHPAQGVVWSQNPQYSNQNINVGVMPNGDTIMAVPASSTVTATNISMSDPLQPVADSITVPPAPAALVPDDNSVTASQTSVISTQTQGDSVSVLPVDTTTQVGTSYFTAPRILVDANGDPLPRHVQPF